LVSDAKRSVLAGQAVLAASLLAAALNPLAAAELKPWRYGVLEPKGDAGFTYMIDRGFAEKQGLKLEIFRFKYDNQLLQALIAGELDAFEGSPGSDIMAAARGADVKIIGCTWPGLPHVILARGLISPQDLRGKSVALGPPGTLPELLVRILLSQNNIPVDAVQFSGLGNDVDRYKALVAHVVDAAVVSNEFLPVMEKEASACSRPPATSRRTLRGCAFRQRARLWRAVPTRSPSSWPPKSRPCAMRPRIAKRR